MPDHVESARLPLRIQKRNTQRGSPSLENFLKRTPRPEYLHTTGNKVHGMHLVCRAMHPSIARQRIEEEKDHRNMIPMRRALTTLRASAK
jgi:hypothetical protein